MVEVSADAMQIRKSAIQQTRRSALRLRAERKHVPTFRWVKWPAQSVQLFSTVCLAEHEKTFSRGTGRLETVENGSRLARVLAHPFEKGC